MGFYLHTYFLNVFLSQSSTVGSKHWLLQTGATVSYRRKVTQEESLFHLPQEELLFFSLHLQMLNFSSISQEEGHTEELEMKRELKAPWGLTFICTLGARL